MQDKLISKRALTCSLRYCKQRFRSEFVSFMSVQELSNLRGFFMRRESRSTWRKSLEVCKPQLLFEELLKLRRSSQSRVAIQTIPRLNSVMKATPWGSTLTNTQAPQWMWCISFVSVADQIERLWETWVFTTLFVTSHFKQRMEKIKLLSQLMC